MKGGASPRPPSRTALPRPPGAAGSRRRVGRRTKARSSKHPSFARWSPSAGARSCGWERCRSAMRRSASAPAGGRRTTTSITPSASSACASAATSSRRATCWPRSMRAMRRALLPRCARSQPPTSSATSRRRGGASCSTWSTTGSDSVRPLMPELPEVETERTRLAAKLEGRTLEAVEIADPRLTRPEDPTIVAAMLEGDRVESVDRRGKYIVLRLASGRALLVHLRMTGGFRYEPASHERATFALDNGARVAYRDLRRFGTWALFEPDEAEEHLAVRVGPEPLERRFTTRFLAERLAGRTAPVKAAILDQRTVAGLGNIYADEALWRAQLNPRREAGSLTAEEIAALRDGVRKALRTGIRYQGADLGDGAYAGGRMQE